MKTMESIYKEVSLYGTVLVDFRGETDRFLAYYYKSKYYYFELEKGELYSSTVFKKEPKTLKQYIESKHNLINL